MDTNGGPRGMRILITNDDGIAAPGLATLREIAASLADEVWVVAPETNQSGTGHSLSLHEHLRMRQLEDRVFAVRGTPTDSVIMAVRHVLAGQKPDLLLSGVNRGANMAEDVTYSGTIAGAFEGTLLGIRSIALSQAFGFEQKTPRFETALAHAPAILRRLIDAPWAPPVLMNINFPDRAPGEVHGITLTEQGRRDLNLVGVEGRRDPWGEAYYWLAYERRRSNARPGTDLAAVYDGAISVTPLSLELTHRPTLDALKSVLTP